MTATLPGRPARFGAWHVMERNLLNQRRCWWAYVSGFFEPLFYLLSLSVGVSHLVGQVSGPDGRGIPYQVFLAPAMLATSAMNGAVLDSTYNLYHKLRHARVFQAVRATPLGARDIALGEIASATVRGGIYAAFFVACMAALGLIRSWWAVLAVPAAWLVGLAFASLGAAATTFVRHLGDLEWVSVALLPMFLFSATFYPLARCPRAVRPLVELSPLYHGVVVTRGLTTGVVGPGLLWHVAVLGFLALLGITVATRRLDRILCD
ncbi:MAG TPA: ABC transporter permease [Sporichthyaceae bacterium]|nr:ABC transporter permease [Sporichthyaceae bacterium]